jgi:hypothetical protein
MCHRENKKNSRFGSMLLLPKLRRCQKKVGQCRMELLGLEIIPGITQE